MPMECSGVLTWYQGFQMPGLTLCFLILFFLLGTVRRPTHFWVPVFYFVSLTTPFMLPFKDMLGMSNAVQGSLIMGEALIPPLSFLLIVQLTGGRIPSLPYWAILAVPLVGGSSLVYATFITQDDTCVYEHICSNPVVFKQFYDIFSTSLVFLLTVFVHRRYITSINESDLRMRGHKFMLVMALIILNLAILAITLGHLDGLFSDDRAAIAATVVRIGFIYLVATSIFRVFDSTFEIEREHKAAALRLATQVSG